MLILDRLSKSNRSLAVALGTFDGLHRGHTALIETMVQDAKERDFESAVFTFAQHPLSVLRPSAAPPLLSDGGQRRLLFAQMGVEQLAEVPFTSQLAMLQPGEFVKEYLASVGAGLVEVGFNFRFGISGLGDAEFLEYAGKQFGFEVRVLESVDEAGETISSSRIRQAIQSGDMQTATHLLGRPYSLRGLTEDGVFRPLPGICMPGAGSYEAQITDGVEHQWARVRVQGEAILLPMNCRLAATAIEFR